MPGVATGALATVVALCLLVAGCGSDRVAGDERSTGAAGGESLSGSIVVSAAASLTEPFTIIRDDLLEQHPDAEITLNFGSSGQLSSQIIEGAPADVAAFADTTSMTALDDAGLLADPPRPFAVNQLTIVTRPGNPAGITGPADLVDVGVVALCATTAPCGRFAEKVLAESGVNIAASDITRGRDVKATLAAVTQGDADAALVYVSDAVAAGDSVEVVELGSDLDVDARYPIALLAGTDAPDLAAAFRDRVLSSDGQAVLRAAGFGAP